MYMRSAWIAGDVLHLPRFAVKPWCSLLCTVARGTFARMIPAATRRVPVALAAGGGC